MADHYIANEGALKIKKFLIFMLKDILQVH